MINHNKAQEILHNVQGTKILVVGDVMLDEYLWGKVRRISPEAPVPIVRVLDKTFNLGGAANVAQNLLSLGVKVGITGVIGNDTEGTQLLSSLSDYGIDTRGIYRDNDRLTTHKTRVIAVNQQVVRIDQETDSPIIGVLREKLITFLEQEIPNCQAVIISDYSKGVVNKPIMNQVIHLINKHNIICSIDPRVQNFRYYKNVTVITPNHHEASSACGIDIDGIESLQKAGFKLLDKTDCSMVLITWGKNGMGLFERGNIFHHIETVSKRVYDVTGAGDTVISVFTAALAAGATPFEAAVLSNSAAGIVVSNVGTASVSTEELLTVMH